MDRRPIGRAMSEPQPKLPDTACCTQCGYLLRGLPENRCPECGRPFDPQDPWSYELPGRRKPRRGSPAGRALVAACLSVGLIVSTRSLHEFNTLSYWLACLAFAVVAWIKLMQAQRAGRADAWEALMVRLALVFLVLWPALLTYSGECRWGHAKVVGVGPVGLAWSNDHGPCHNIPFGNGKHIHLYGRWWIAWLDHDWH